MLTNKVAVVTGASAGIGKAIARDLSAAGVQLVLCARRGDRLRALAAELPGPAALLEGDIASPDIADRLLSLACSRFGSADTLINNAGILSVAPLEAVDLDKLDRVISVNFSAVVRTSYVFARYFKARQQGAIINVSSIGATLHLPHFAVYGATKAALESFTASLRVEMAGTGVRVGTIAPGSTASEIFESAKEYGDQRGPTASARMAPAAVAAAVRFMLDQPDGANIATMRIYSDSERA